jgi:hypothetical protein
MAEIGKIVGVFFIFVFILILARASFHGIHSGKVNPGGVTVSVRVCNRTLNLRAVPFTELLHLVAALDGGFRRVSGGKRGHIGDRISDFLPMIRPEIPSPE